VRIRSAHVRGFRSIADSGPVELGSITVLIGANNTGKSAFLHAHYQLQQGSPQPPQQFVRKGVPSWSVDLSAGELSTANPFEPTSDGVNEVQITVHPHASRPGEVEVVLNGSNHRGQITSQEPGAFIYPSFAKRKVTQFQRSVDISTATTVRADFTYLVSRLTRLSNPDFPGADAYRTACRDILGFVVTAFPSDGGMQAGQYFDVDTPVELEAMGEGVTSIVGLLVELATARNKLFLIEEPENDLHPAALKSILDLVLASAEDNQFIVSTHSNIVLRYLGSHPDAKVIRVSTELGQLPPVSTFTPIEATPAARLAVLRELGYELADLDLYEGWLILEESSAERLIRQYFLKWFAPKLVGRLRTMAANGTGDVEPTFRDLHRMCLYGHLETAYQGRVWVICDGDPSGADAIAKLSGKYTDWPANRFRTWSRANFEDYYPERFAEARDAAMALQGSAKRDAKKRLLDDVLAFFETDEATAQAEFETSAADAIVLLLEIEAELT
jgi:hypothetical protein